jgi:hypothetical protein
VEDVVPERTQSSPERHDASCARNAVLPALLYDLGEYDSLS